MQHAHEHGDRGGGDGAIAVTDPGMLGAGAADHDVAAIAPGFGQQRQQEARRRLVRQQVGFEATLQFTRRLVEHTAAQRFLAQRQHDAGERPIERVQLAGEFFRGRFIGDIAFDHDQVDALARKGRATLTQFGQAPGVASDRDHRAGQGQGGFHHAAADRVGRIEDDDRGFHRPTFGTFIPDCGIIPPDGLEGRTAPTWDKAREMAAARWKVRGRIGDMWAIRGTWTPI